MRIQTANGTLNLRRVKPAAVAGLFYPGERGELKRLVDGLLERADASGDPPKALVVPHAGYRYSGAVAASGYAHLRAHAGTIRRVVLAGPAHHVGFRGVAVCGAGAFETPLGNVEVDDEAVARVLRLPCVQRLDRAYEREHSLEVHLPFLVESLERFRIVPLLVGDVAPWDMAAVLEAVWGGPETLVVISTDLSHYHDYDTARRLDASTDEAIRALRFEDIDPGGACGRHGLAGLLLLARRDGLGIRRVDLRNSGDTAGGRDRVVGYGAWIVAEGRERRISLRDRRVLLSTAANAIRLAVEHGEEAAPEPPPDAAVLREPGACFVTLTLDGRLRGCMGSLQPMRPLLEDAAANARSAAVADPRFEPLPAADLERLEISVSVLGPSTPIAFDGEADLVGQLRPGVDGLVLSEGARRGTFLPAVWENLPEPAQFLRELKRKAGLARDYWSPGIRVERYTTESFS